MTVMESSFCFGDGHTFPPGFRFHPTDEELVLFYLKRKICRRRFRPDAIGVIDVYKWDPEDLPGLSKLRTGDRQWFFFSPRDRKYPNGARSNRATNHGYWKATGKDRAITYSSRTVGSKKTLVFYRGRAPTGERTDWVMHEYTLDEEELNRCRFAPDYYALYKLYKKSGPGPKNGEQYGAPFREEDWCDGDGRVHDVASVDPTQLNNKEEAPFDGLQEWLNGIADDAILLPQPPAFDNHSQQLLLDEDRSVIELSSGESNFIAQVTDISCSQPDNVQRNFNLVQSDTSNFSQFEASDVRFSPNMNGKEPCVAEEDILEDFLEIADLLDKEPTIQDFEKVVENSQKFDELDGLCEFDLYHDAPMCLNEMGSCEPEQMCQPYMHISETALVSQVPDLYFNSPINDATTTYQTQLLCELGQMYQPYLNNPEGGTVKQASDASLNIPESCTSSIYQLQTQLTDSDQMSCQLEGHGQKENSYAPADASYGTTIIPSQGMIFADTSINHSTGVNQHQSNREENDSESRFLSALWSFVESIPSAPASASESDMVSRVLVRVSSFRRPINVTGATVNSSTSTARHGRSRMGFVCFSIVGLLCGILWMLRK